MEINELIILIALIVFSYIGLFFGWEFHNHRNKKIKFKISRIAKDYPKLTPSDFFQLRNEFLKNKSNDHTIEKYNFAGVYVIYNRNKKMYYVGQAKKILDRVNNHFTGKGNGDVYADYKYGDKFTIQLLKYDQKAFKTLNEFERYTILAYDAFRNGYNKTRGNY